MSKNSTLTTTPITDEAVLRQCKDALNKWSNGLPFAITRKLGDDGQLISATMYHAYTLGISTEFATRKFDLQKGGNPVNNPRGIDDYDMWNISGADITGNYDLPLKDTCYAETCGKCGGDGKVECGKCHGHGEVECSDCHGHGVSRCGSCGGKGEEKCSECSGAGKTPCPVCSPSLGSIGGLHFIGKSSTKKEYCRRCGGEGWVSCSKCGGSGTKTCSKCHGAGEIRCKTCHESGRVRCSTCKGSGQVTCSHCDGKGYIPYMYHLIQKQENDTVEAVWGDPGIGELLKFKKYEKYPGVDLFARRAENDEQVSVDEFPEYEAEFIDELKSQWQEFYSKYDGVADAYLHFEEVKVRQINAAIRYEYKYKDKDYLIWIDLTSGKVFETEERGLMTEWGKKVADEGDKEAKKFNPQMAIFHYAMASAITTNNKGHAKKLRGQLCLGSWLFRLAAGGLGGWLWTIFLGAQGADPVSGWYLMGAMLVIDILFAQKWFWMQLIAVGATYGLLRYLYLIPGFFSPQIASDVYIQAYIMNSILMFVGASLLFARDFSLRIRGGILVFPLLGALVGAATAPEMYLDFSPNPESMTQIMTYVTYGICGLAVLRTWNRYWVQNCGWIAQKAPAGIVRVETNMLKPRFWPMPIYFLLFAAVGGLWYQFAGPGVSIEMKAKVAERFLENECTRAKGKYYLAEAIKADYLPAITRLAELQIMGQCGYAEEPAKGYELAVKAGERNDAKAWRLQGYCLEYGKGVAQNLTDANARYAKASELGDVASAELKQKTDDIAKVWTSAQNGDKDAQYGLAVCYANGNGIGKDEGLARVWLLKAADSGHVKSQLLVCDWLIKGIGGAKDPELGVKYCEKAALQDDPEAIAVLGYYYFDGKIISQDYPKAIESFNRASDKGSESAPYMLGYCYREGLGVDTNVVKACEYFALADKRGSLPGAYAHGECLEYGKGVEINYTEAQACYKRASGAEWDAPLLGKSSADAKSAEERISEIGTYWNAANCDGDGSAMDKVGLCYANGTGVEKSAEIAYGWYVKSAEKDCMNGIVHMADALYDGIGVHEDKNASGKAYERAAQKGSVHATFRLATCLENGWGVEKNLTKAYARYVEASTNDYAGASEAAKRIEEPARYWDAAFNGKDGDAQYNLAMCYRAGNCGVEQNMEEAFKLFRMSAAQGHAAALYEVSRCYATGIGVTKDDAEMKNTAILSAEKNYPAALYFVGELYQAGRSVPYDPTTAYAYYEKASKAGFHKAAERAATIDKIGKFWNLAHKGDADAQYQLGICYRDGIQIASDALKAKQWFEKAVAQGEHNAEYALAEIKASEDDNEAKNKEVVALLEKAVAGGNVKAKVMLGKFLYTGKGVDEDYDRSVKLWEAAMSAGNLDAKYCLGDYYYTGRGLFNSGKDQEKALKLWGEASAAGNRNSSLRLAKLYSEGSGLFGSDKDPAKARRYAELAEEQNKKPEVVDPLGGFEAFESLKNVKPELVTRPAEEEAVFAIRPGDPPETSQENVKLEQTQGAETTNEASSDVIVSNANPNTKDMAAQSVEPTVGQNISDNGDNHDAPTNTAHEADASVGATAEPLDGQVALKNGRDKEIEDSLVIYREYLTTMHGKDKASRAQRKDDWGNKFKGKRLLLPAVMKKVKRGKVDCLIEDKSVVIEMRRDQINRAASIRKGEKFLVRGTISDKRLGIMHVLGLSDGEIVDEPSDSN